MIRGASRTLGYLASAALGLGGCSPDTESLWNDSAVTGGAGSPPSAAGSSARSGAGGRSNPADSGGTSPSSGAPPGGSASSDTAGTASGGVATTQGGSTHTDPPGTHPRQKLEPQDGHTLLFVGQDSGEIDDYAKAFGMPAGVMLYTNVWDGLGVLSASDFGGYGWSDLSRWQSRPEQFALQVGMDLDHGQNCGNCGNCTRAGFLEQLAQGDGARVGLVHAIVKALRDTGRPVLLRVGYEFDGEICPGGFGKYPMAAYQQAFKRVHDIVQDEHADRIALVWNAWAFQARDPGKAVGVAPWGWYPGDDVVDWIGLSVFPGFAAGDITEQYQTDKRRQLAEFAKQHGKPLMIAESTPRARFAPALGDAAWNGWYSGVFDYIEQSDAKAFSYINMNWEALPMWHGQGWGDTRVQGSAVAQKWQAALSGAHFITSSPGLYQELGL